MKHTATTHNKFIPHMHINLESKNERDKQRNAEQRKQRIVSMKGRKK